MCVGHDWEMPTDGPERAEYSRWEVGWQVPPWKCQHLDRSLLLSSHSGLWSEISHRQAALKQEAQGKRLLIQTQNSSLNLVSKVISGESGGKMTKLGWLLYLFGFEWSVGSDPVLLFLAGCGTEEDSKQWGTLHLCLFCLLVTFPACHF